MRSLQLGTWEAKNPILGWVWASKRSHSLVTNAQIVQATDDASTRRLKVPERFPCEHDRGGTWLPSHPVEDHDREWWTGVTRGGKSTKMMGNHAGISS
jgi:hypothetical protein